MLNTSKFGANGHHAMSRHFRKGLIQDGAHTHTSINDVHISNV